MTSQNTLCSWDRLSQVGSFGLRPDRLSYAMTRKKKDVTDAELALLQVLWESGGLTIRDLTDAVYPEGGESDYATVKKLLARLESKGFVHRDRSG